MPFDVGALFVCWKIRGSGIAAPLYRFRHSDDPASVVARCHMCVNLFMPWLYS